MATAVLQPTSLPISRSMSTPSPSTSASSSSSSSSSQPLIDHALLMLTLSRRLSTTEHEQERAVEMREDALKLLVLGEEMQRAEERQSSVASTPHGTPPESPAARERRLEVMDAVENVDVDKQGETKEDGANTQHEDDGYHLIPPAYVFAQQTSPSLSLTSSPPRGSFTSAAAAAAMQSLPTNALIVSPASHSSAHSLSRVNSNSALTHLSPDAITASLSTLLTQADLLLGRLHRKYDTYLSPLLSQSQSTLHTLMESEEARVMVDEGRDVVREWREFMGSREGDAMVSSLLSMMAAQQLGVGDLIKYATDAVASVVTGSGSAAAAPNTQTLASSALVPIESSKSTAVSASSNSHTFLYTMPEHIRSFLLAHPEMNLFLLRAQSALLAPEPSSSTSPPSELDQLLSAFSERTSSLLTSLSSPATAHQLPNGKTQLLSTRTADLLSDLSSPLLHLIKSPERVFSEAVLLLMRGKAQCDQVLDDLKHLIIQQLSTALSNFTFPAVDGGNSAFQYTFDSFALHSFHLHADDIQLHTSDEGEEGRLVIEIKRVDAEAREVRWTCKQLVFPYMSGSGTLDVRLRDASMRVEVGVSTATPSTAVANGSTVATGSGEASAGGVRLVQLTFSFPSLSFHTANTSFSSVYNLLLSLFGPLLRSELERAVNEACREKVEELLSLVNEYGGGVVVRRWWVSSTKGTVASLNGHAKPSEVLAALTADVMRDSAEDDRNSRLATSAASLPHPPLPAPLLTAAVVPDAATAVVAVSSASLSSADPFSTPPPPRHPSVVQRSALVSQSTPVSACVSPSSTSSTSSSSSSSSSSSWLSGRLTPSSSSPFLRTNTPPIMLAYPDTASGW